TFRTTHAALSASCRARPRSRMLAKQSWTTGSSARARNVGLVGGGMGAGKVAQRTAIRIRHSAIILALKDDGVRTPSSSTTIETVRDRATRATHLLVRRGS